MFRNHEITTSDSCVIIQKMTKANNKRAKSTDREPVVSLQWFGHSFRRSDFVTKWGFGQDGSGDSKNIFRIALLSQSALLVVSLFAVSLLAVRCREPNNKRTGCIYVAYCKQQQ